MTPCPICAAALALWHAAAAHVAAGGEAPWWWHEPKEAA